MAVRESWGAEADDLLGEIESGFAQWLPTTGAFRADATTVILGRMGQSSYVLSWNDGTTKNVRMPDFISGRSGLLRRAMVDPLRGSVLDRKSVV